MMEANTTTVPATIPVKLPITKLMAAAKQGNIEAIQSSLSAYGLPPNGTKTTDYLILQLALQRGRKEIAKLLLQAGCNVDDPTGNCDPTLSTPLYLAVYHEYDDIVMMLLQNGATVDIKDYHSGQTPVHLAAVRRSTNILWKLLHFSSDVNLCDNKGRPVLQILLDQCIYECRGMNKTVHPEIVGKLLTKGALVNCRGRLDQTPLHLAAKLKQKDILPILLPFCTDQNQCDTEGNSVLHALLSTEYSNSGCDNEALNLEIASALLRRGARPDLINNNGQCPVHLAAKNRHLKILSMLLQYATDVNRADYEGKTILHRLLDNYQSLGDGLLIEFMQVVRLLVSMGAKADLKSKQDDTALHVAARCAGKEPNILWILFQGVEIDGNVTDVHGNTVLHLLASEPERNIQLVNLLLQKGLLVDAKNTSNETPARIAAKNKRLALLHQFIPYIVDVNFCDDEHGNTILHLLLINCVGEEWEIMMELLQMGASVDIKNKTGITPLFYAALSKQMQILLILLRNSMDLASQVAFYDSCNMTLLHLVLRTMYVYQQVQVNKTSCEILEILLANGALIDHRSILQQMPIHQEILFKHPDLISIFSQLVTRANVSGNKGKTLVYFLEKLPAEALRQSEMQVIELAKILLSNGASLEGINEAGRSPLDLACRSRELLRVLLQYSEDVTKPRDSKGNTVLHTYLLGKERSLETVRMLVDKGAEVDVSNKTGQTTLHLAAKIGEYEILQFLLLHSNDINACDKLGNSVLHVLLSSKPTTTTPAPSKNNNPKLTVSNSKREEKLLDIVDMLLQIGLNVDSANTAGETHLHLACRNFRPEVCRLLLKRGAEARAIDKLANTCQHFLCEGELEKREEKETAAMEKETLRYFLSHGCGVNDKNKRGSTPLHVAAEHGRMNLAEALVANGADVSCAETTRGAQALHLAVANQRAKVVEILLRCGADVNSRQADGRSALQLCLRQHRSRRRPPPDQQHRQPVLLLLSRLLEHKADTEQRDQLGKSALHWACWHDDRPSLRLLLEHGASIDARDKGGFTPLYYATSQSTRLTALLHLAKLRAAGLVVNEDNSRLCREIASLYLARESIDVLNLDTEISELRQLSVDPRTTLYDVLHMSPNRLSVYRNNIVFQEILASADYDTRYPQYGYLIRACARLGKARGELLEAAMANLSRLTGNPLPESCCCRIFESLSNECLRSLIKAGSNGARKRRMSDSELEDDDRGSF